MTEKIKQWIDGVFFAEAASAKDEIMLFPFGEYKHPVYGKLKFDAKFFSDIIGNFTSNVLGIKPFVDIEHRMGEAVAWLEEAPYVKEGVGLFIKPKWTALGEKLLGEKTYRYFSPWFEDFTDANGKTHKNVLRGGAVTNIPFLKTMPSILEEKNQSLSELKALTIQLSDLTDNASDAGGNADDGKTSQTANRSDGNNHGGTNMDADKKLADKMIPLSKVCALLGLPNETEENEVYEKIGAMMKPASVSMSEKQLSEKHAKLQEQFIDLSKKLAERDCRDAIESAITAGKILPKDKDAWSKRFLADPAGMTELISILPVVVKLGEKGSAGEGEPTVTDPAEKLMSEVKKVQIEKKVGFSDAMGIVCAAQPELYAAYDNARKGA